MPVAEENDRQTRLKTKSHHNGVIFTNFGRGIDKKNVNLVSNKNFDNSGNLDL